MSEFEKGYICAVAKLMWLEGCVTPDIKELYRAVGSPTEEKCRLSGICDYDAGLIGKIEREVEKEQVK